MVQQSVFQRVVILAIVGLMVFASAATAQDDPESGLGDEEESGSATGQWGGSEQAQPKSDSNWSYNQSSSASADSSSSSGGVTGSDHEQVTGTVGIGYFGVLSLPLGVSVGDPTDPDAGGINNRVPAPTIGIRFWLSEFLGIEAALGIGISDDSGDTGFVETSDSAVGFALHGGLPLAFAHSGHFVFEVVPELNLGIASGSTIPNMDDEAQDLDHSGFLFQLGARAGGEVHFGFIDIPQLALQASVGVYITHESGSTESDGGEVSSSSTYFGTTVIGEPWDIFTGNIAAIYYIP